MGRETRVLLAQGQDRLLDSTLHRSHPDLQGYPTRFLSIFLAADDNQYSLAFIQYQWAASPAGNGRLQLHALAAQVPAVDPTWAEGKAPLIGAGPKPPDGAQ